MTSKKGISMGDELQLSFDRELKWCIQSLEHCMKANPNQLLGSRGKDSKKKVFDVLNSSKVSLVRKRYVFISMHVKKFIGVLLNN